MSTTKSLIFASFVASVSLAACVPKAELDTTKQQLEAVSLERDALKAQLEASKQQTAVLQLQVKDLQAKVTAAATALVAPDADAKHEGAKGDKKPEAAKADKSDKKAAGGMKPAAKPGEPAKTP